MGPPTGPRILLVDDNNDLRELAETVLERAGFEVRALPSAHEVDEHIAKFAPDVIISDVLMPGESGLSLCRRLRAQPATADIPILLVSAKSAGGDRRAAMDAGADRYLVKPVRRAVLLASIAEVLETELRVEVFGSRGSLPLVPPPREKVSRFGGHTTCVRVHAGRRPEVLVLDAGTGLRNLGRALRRDGPIDAHLFLSHYHLDHIYGLPFFAPLYGAANRVTIYGGVDFPPNDSDARAHAERELENTIGGPFDNRYWPVSMDDLPGTVVYRPFYDDSVAEFEVANTKISMCKVNHGQITYAYKLAYPAAAPRSTVVYVPDNEILPESLAGKRLGDMEVHLRNFVADADLLIHDCTYSQEAYMRHRGWGHTSAATLARFCAVAEVPEVMLFHHDPDATDQDIESVLAEFEDVSALIGSKTRARLAVEGETVMVGSHMGRAQA